MLGVNLDQLSTVKKKEGRNPPLNYYVNKKMYEDMLDNILNHASAAINSNSDAKTIGSGEEKGKDGGLTPLPPSTHPSSTNNYYE